MFAILKQRIADMRTIKTLCLEAERQALADGEREPGLEHFMLAALDLPDGSARRAFTRVGADPDGFREAIARQYREALGSIGIAAAVPAMPATAPDEGPYRAKPQVQALMRGLAGREKGRGGLLGAHVVEQIAGTQHGVAARALACMGVAGAALAEAARAEAAGARA